MKVISKIDDRKFVVELEENELQYQMNNTIVVNHDYVNVLGSVPVCGKETIYPWVGIHLSIREMIQLVLPYLQQHPYMQKEHLFYRDEDGKVRDNYTYYTGDVTLVGHETSERLEDGLHINSTDKHYVRKSDKKVYHVTETTKGCVIPKNFKENGYKDIDLPDEVREYDIDMHEL